MGHRGQSPADLLETYSEERQPVAQELIDFDREWSAMMAAAPKDQSNPEASGVTAEELQEYFVRQGRYTAGVATLYPASRLIGGGKHQHLAEGYPVGMRFHSAPVVRAADAKRVELGHVHRADGRWRIYLFAGADEAALLQTCRWLASDPASPIVTPRREGADIDGVIDVRAVLQRPHREVTLGSLPELLLPRTGALGLQDYEKVFSAAGVEENIYDLRGIDAKAGCAVIVRPDQYVAEVLPLADTAGIAEFIARALA